MRPCNTWKWSKIQMPMVSCGNGTEHLPALPMSYALPFMQIYRHIHITSSFGILRVRQECLCAQFGHYTICCQPLIVYILISCHVTCATMNLNPSSICFMSVNTHIMS